MAAISRSAGAGNLAPVEVSLNEGKEEIYRPTDGKTPDLATLAGLTGTAGITMAGGAAITANDVGSTLVVAGKKFTVLGIVGGLVNVGQGFSTAIAAQAGAVGPPVVPATPVADNTFAATKEWYLIRPTLSTAPSRRTLCRSSFDLLHSESCATRESSDRVSSLCVLTQTIKRRRLNIRVAQ